MIVDRPDRHGGYPSYRGRGQRRCCTLWLLTTGQMEMESPCAEDVLRCSAFWRRLRFILLKDGGHLKHCPDRLERDPLHLKKCVWLSPTPL